MASTASLQMSYDDMQTEINYLKQCVSDFNDSTKNMTDSVNRLCDGWVSASTQAYQNDYEALVGNFKDTLGVVDKLIESTSQYIADMQEVDNTYSKSKVQVG